jgi:hypothetical protein
MPAWIAHHKDEALNLVDHQTRAFGEGVMEGRGTGRVPCHLAVGGFAAEESVGSAGF